MVEFLRSNIDMGVRAYSTRKNNEIMSKAFFSLGPKLYLAIELLVDEYVKHPDVGRLDLTCLLEPGVDPVDILNIPIEHTALVYLSMKDALASLDHPDRSQIEEVALPATSKHIASIGPLKIIYTGEIKLNFKGSEGWLQPLGYKGLLRDCLDMEAIFKKRWFEWLLCRYQQVDPRELFWTAEYRIGNSMCVAYYDIRCDSIVINFQLMGLFGDEIPAEDLKLSILHELLHRLDYHSPMRREMEEWNMKQVAAIGDKTTFDMTDMELLRWYYKNPTERNVNIALMKYQEMEKRKCLQEIKEEYIDMWTHCEISDSKASRHSVFNKKVIELIDELLDEASIGRKGAVCWEL